jgi:hypothetical protein
MAFKKAKSLHCARERNMLMWLVVIIAPLLVLSLIAVIVPAFRPYFPSFEVKSCFLRKGQYFTNGEIDYEFKRHLLFTVEVYLLFNFFIEGIFMGFIYLLRKV